MPLSKLKEKDPAFNEPALLERIGNLYVQMQDAWQSKNFEPMRAFMTDALFNQMARQLDELKRQGLTNYVDRIAVLDSFISRYYQEDDNDVLVIRLSTRICDYTVRDDTGELVRGNKTRELFMTYDWKLIRQKDRKTLEQADMSTVNWPELRRAAVRQPERPVRVLRQRHHAVRSRLGVVRDQGHLTAQRKLSLPACCCRRG